MAALENLTVGLAWAGNAFGVVLVLATRAFSHTKTTWALVGVALLLIALLNAWVFLAAGIGPSTQVAAIFGLVVLGSLGARLVGNWLTEGAV